MLTLDLNKNPAMVLDLNKNDLTQVNGELTWQMHPIMGRSLTAGFDLDIFAYAADAYGKISELSQIIYFKNRDPYAGAIVLSADDRTGGDGEDITFDLPNIPANVAKVDIFVFIFEATKRNQHFGMMQNAKFTFTNPETGEGLAEYRLQDYSGDTALHLGSLVRVGNGWQFEPVGEANVADPQEVLAAYAS